jgi:hypothetical protein
MPGLVPGIHVLATSQYGNKKDVDGRDKPGHDECVEPFSTKRMPNVEFNR